jgi:hypothetical protein
MKEILRKPINSNNLMIWHGDCFILKCNADNIHHLTGMVHRDLIPEGEFSQENFAAFSLAAERAADFQEGGQDLQIFQRAATGNRGHG